MHEKGTSYRAIVPFIIQDKAVGTQGTDPLHDLHDQMSWGKTLVYREQERFAGGWCLQTQCDYRG